jgi:hypothetical protein
MELSDVTFGTEASQFKSRYGLREDALRYARAHAAVEYEDENEDVIVVIGHDPNGRRYRFSCRKDRPSHVLTFRPVPAVVPSE